MSDQFFSSSGFAADQYCRGGVRYLRDLLKYMAHRTSIADDVREIVSFAELFQKMRVLVFEPTPLVIDQMFRFDRLSHHGGNQVQRFEFGGIVTIGLETKINPQCPN